MSTTKQKRKVLLFDLEKDFRWWRSLSTEDLLAQVQRRMPGVNVSGNDRETMLQFLVLELVKEMI